MLLLLLVSFAFLLQGLAALTCLQCDGVSQPRHCKYAVQCFDGEVCGVEKVTNALGQSLFNVGCVHTSRCSSNSAGGANLGSCHECCHSNLCNAAGCGEIGYPLARGPICYACPMQVDINTCGTIEFCEQGEVCAYTVRKEFGDTVYSSKCANRHTCTASGNDGVAIVGRDVDDNLNNESNLKRRTVKDIVCGGCCEGDLCNWGCNTTTAAPTSACDKKPCVHGHCIDQAGDYTCVCDNGYYGQNCTLSACDKKPCVHGHCIDQAGDYICVCDNGYFGQNCTLSACDKKPCVHGHCIDQAGGYTCVCDNGYYGQNCSDVPSDCHDIKSIQSDSVTGLYRIRLWKSNESIEVMCDMETSGGGWTVFQNRFNGSCDFYRNFATYTNGFGNLKGEFWLGLKYIQELASQGHSELRIYISDANGTMAYETFASFSLSPGPNYTLHILKGNSSNMSSYRGNGLLSHNNMHFSTFDRDVDTYRNDNCARIYHGGWWFRGCMGSDPNGYYFAPGTTNTSSMSYHDFKGSYESLRTSKMMLRRV